jgi:hypothetical protein
LTLLSFALLGLSSCMGIDNYDEPNCRFYGNVVDTYTEKNILASQDGFKIRIWERSWTKGTLVYQDLSVKQDGSYNDTKLFAGTYDMLPYGGAFWPADTVKNVKLDGTTEQDFKVTPYLQILDFKAVLDGTNLVISCRLKAPKTAGLPDLREIMPFVSLTQFCGNTNYINIGEYTDARLTINKSWADEVGTSDTSKVYTLAPIPVKSGYTYYVRVGAAVNDSFNNYNYSEIQQISVP